MANENPNQYQIVKAYTSFSGSDMHAYINTNKCMELQGISFAITREKAPVYTLGSPDLRSVSRNKRHGNLLRRNNLEISYKK